MFLIGYFAIVVILLSRDHLQAFFRTQSEHTAVAPARLLGVGCKVRARVKVGLGKAGACSPITALGYGCLGGGGSHFTTHGL